jgi:fructose-1,6-bisphosphatase/inositol monophosphatase family enzyme
MNNLLKNLQDLGDAKHDDLSVAHDALAEIVNLRLINEELRKVLVKTMNLYNSTVTHRDQLFEKLIESRLKEKKHHALTNEEISDAIDDALEGGGWLDVARALEAAIKRKNYER